MKKFLLIPLSIIVAIGIAIGIYWSTLWSNHSGPEFVATQDALVAEPIVKKSGDIYTITWSTADNYPTNEVVMKSRTSQYPDAGVGADSVYDPTRGVYIHSARFRLTDNNVVSEIPVFAFGNYTYQVKSSGLANKAVTTSSVLSL